MKKLLLLFTFLSIASGIFSQVSKSLNLDTAGTLSASMSLNELSTITNLTLTGTVDARDFKTMREEMPLLAVLDLSGVTIVAYSGTEGSSWNTNYAANAVPENAFLNPDTSQGKKSLISVILPSSITSIGKVAFRRCSGLTSVTIPTSVISIGISAFEGCSGLTSLTIPSSVTTIDNSAFYYCSGLTSVDIPSSVISIGVGAFGYCSKLPTVNIPSSVTSIQKATFQGCSALTTIAIPSSVTSIGDFAFGSCSGLTTVLIPSLVTSIGNSAFHGCSGMTSITIPNSVISIGKGAFQSCSALTTVTIPSSVTSIGDFAFRGCSGMTSVTIPSSVTSIREGAFEHCSALTSITVTNRTPVNLGMSYNVFNNVDKFTCTLNVPLGSKSAYQTAPEWKDFYNIIEKNLTGIDPMISDQKLTLYPNPTTGKMKIVFAQIPEKGTTLTVNDFTGKTILTQLIQNKEEAIDLGGNLPGVYLIQTNMEDFKVQKVILK